MFDKGFEDYYKNRSYSAETSAEWMRGWATAERESRCGWYDRHGRPNRDRNKDFS